MNPAINGIDSPTGAVIKAFLRKLIVPALSLMNNDRARLLRIRNDNLTYLSGTDLANLQAAVREVQDNDIEGVFVEAGCALGGSSLAIGFAKERRREFIIYDTFGMIPPPSSTDLEDVHKRYEVIRSGRASGIGENVYYGYVPNLKDVVQQTFERYGFDLGRDNIRLVEGLFEDTIEVNDPVAFAHIDCDWYESVITCLERIEPHVERGGILVFDDYYTWSGCRLAVDEYFRHRKERYELASVDGKLHARRLH